MSPRRQRRNGLDRWRTAVPAPPRRAGVVINEETRAKKTLFHPGMLPRAVICDPALTVGLPPAITAGTGMDAFAHCLEACCAPAATWRPAAR